MLCNVGLKAEKSTSYPAWPHGQLPATSQRTVTSEASGTFSCMYSSETTPAGLKKKLKEDGFFLTAHCFNMSFSQTSSLQFPWLYHIIGEGDVTPLQYSCLENPMDRGALWAAVHGVAKSRTRLSNFSSTFHFYALEKEMATHSSVLAWRIPGTGEPGRLPSMGLHRVGHDWSDLAAAFHNKHHTISYNLPNLSRREHDLYSDMKKQVIELV